MRESHCHGQGLDSGEGLEEAAKDEAEHEWVVTYFIHLSDGLSTIVTTNVWVTSIDNLYKHLCMGCRWKRKDLFHKTVRLQNAIAPKYERNSYWRLSQSGGIFMEDQIAVSNGVKRLI